MVAECDNMLVVTALRAGTCKERHTMHLLRCLAFLEAQGQFVLTAVHLRGVDNGVADALSRGKLSMAHSMMQAAEEEAMEVPGELLGVLARPGSSESERGWTALSRMC